MEKMQVPQSQSLTDLPMIVQLRGDEDIVEEFTVDADQAMTLLGIKRSRLTQISGRELRVARIRKDRYVRPMYRQQDLDDYRSWTRATATHQSSSQALQDVLTAIKATFEENHGEREEDRIEPLMQRMKSLQGEAQSSLLALKREQRSMAKTLKNTEFGVGAKLKGVEADLGAVKEKFSAFHQKYLTESGLSRDLIEALNKDLHQVLVSFESRDQEQMKQMNTVANHVLVLAERMNRFEERVIQLNSDFQKAQQALQKMHQAAQDKESDREDIAKLKRKSLVRRARSGLSKRLPRS